MIDKEIKPNKTTKVEKTVKAASKAEIAPPIQTKISETSIKADKSVKNTSKVKVEKSVQAKTSETSIKTEKQTKQAKSEKANPIGKEKGARKKRISKGMATHNRRVKQEQRNPRDVHK